MKFQFPLEISDYLLILSPVFKFDFTGQVAPLGYLYSTLPDVTTVSVTTSPGCLYRHYAIDTCTCTEERLCTGQIFRKHSSEFEFKPGTVEYNCTIPL